MLKNSDLGDTVPLTRAHARADFSCGVRQLDNYIKDRAIADNENNMSRVFVLPLKKEPEAIVGYYSLSSIQVPMDGLPEQVAKRFKYKVVGATLLGRLAVDQRWQKDKCELRLGEYLLLDAMYRTWIASKSVSSYALVVDVLVAEMGDPAPFYLKKGFQPFLDRSDRLYLSMTTIEEGLRAAGLLDLD